jgi:serine/threonine-protein kinase
MIGRVIGQYRIVGHLGKGGMGTVYHAVDESLERDVAIKVLNPDLADSEILKRFRAEATILAKLNHPSIATIYELFPWETGLLMVMEFVRGRTLEQIAVSMGRMKPELAASLVRDVLSALAHAHRAGIVHRDIKPANVMVTEHGGVKVMDFGIARVRGKEQAADGYLMGTPAYMAPEQVLGQKVDGRADLYAAGVMLFRLVTGTLPFKAETATAVLLQQVSEPPPIPRVDGDSLADWCDPIMQRALAKSPTDRFQTAEEFRQALGEAAGAQQTELTKVLAASLTAVEMAPSSPPSVLERFGLTLVPVPSPRTLVLATARVAPIGEVPASGARTAAFSKVADVVLRNGLGRTALPSVVGVLVVALTVGVGLAVSRRSGVPQPQRRPGAHPTAPFKSDSPTSSARGEIREPTAPFKFDAIALLGSGTRRQERKANVVLADGEIRVHANGSQKLLQSVPYADVTSISYSHGRDPLWNAPGGPAAVARTDLDFGMFWTDRHWLSLHTPNEAGQFVVLRLENDAQARRVITALEERTGRKVVTVSERRNRA